MSVCGCSKARATREETFAKNHFRPPTNCATRASYRQQNVEVKHYKEIMRWLRMFWPISNMDQIGQSAKLGPGKDKHGVCVSPGARPLVLRTNARWLKTWWSRDRNLSKKADPQNRLNSDKNSIWRHFFNNPVLAARPRLDRVAARQLPWMAMRVLPGSIAGQRLDSGVRYRVAVPKLKSTVDY